MNPVRIAHILPFANLGGTEKATLSLAEAAAHCGFENTLYCPREADELKRYYHRHCFVTGSYDQVEPSYHHPLPYVQAARALADDFKRHHVRIVHCADILGAHYTALAGRLAGAFVVSHVRCQHSSISRRDQTFLSPVQHFVFASQNTWDVFGMRVPAQKGEVVYDTLPDLNGLEESRDEARAHYRLRADSPVIGMASRVHPCKDFESLIRAAKIVSERFPSCTYLIVGDYEKDPGHRKHYEHLQSELREAGMSDRFVFAGFESNMSRFFAAIDGFVLSSHGEGLPLVILEAMAHSKPVVASNVGGVPEIVSHGKTGLVVPPKEPDALAQALSSLLSDANRADDLGRAAREHVRQNFSRDRFQRQVRNLYCQIARRQGFVGQYAPCMPM